MNILYLSCHSINEYEDLKLFTELGHTCISQGTYNDPAHLGADAARPKLDLPYFPELNPLAKLDWVNHVDVIPEKLVDWADLVYILGIEAWLPVNWERIKRKKVVFRSIGQAVAHTESVLAKYRPQGLKVVRYSPFEKIIPGYSGSDAMIRFYKDEDEYRGWTGERKEVVTVQQSMRYRNKFLKYSVFDEATAGFPRMLYGRGNSPTEESWWGGELSYEDLKRVLRESGAYFYTCTFPAPYTMNFMEAWMTGIPVVAIGSQLAGFNVETPVLIQNGVDGFWSNEVQALRMHVADLLNDEGLARRIGEQGRARAIHYFGKEKARAKWKAFFESLS